MENFIRTESISSSRTVGVLTTSTFESSILVTDSKFSTMRMSHSLSSRISPNSLSCCSLGTRIPDDFVDIPMDSILIEQVLLNLLENAVFHAKGMTELSLSVSLVENQAVFEVADNGCGIPEDALQKIFSGSYEKSAAPVDGTRSNMGIGLSVCAAIVKAHGSEITAENRKGGGAVFRFALERGGEDDGQ